MIIRMYVRFVNDVTSLAEVWIEIYRPRSYTMPRLSLPLRKCGLKSYADHRTGAGGKGHFPCGSVD